MSKFKEIIFMAFIAVGLTSFTTTVEFVNSELGTGGTVCRSVRTDCGGGQWSLNRACVTYSTAQHRSAAIFSADFIAGAGGRASCEAMNEIRQASTTIDR